MLRHSVSRLQDTDRRRRYDTYDSHIPEVTASSRVSTLPELPRSFPCRGPIPGRSFVWFFGSCLTIVGAALSGGSE
jgi:hypothetical protein